MDFDSLPDDSAPVTPTTAPGGAPNFDTLQDDSETYGTPGQQVLTGLEGASQGFAGPLATAAETGLSKLGVPGITGEDQRARAAANPWTHGLSEAAGFGAGLLTGTGEAALIGEAGRVAAGALTHGMPALTTGAKLAAGAASAATEMGLLQAGDEASKWIQNDPEQSVSSAITNVGLSAALGGATGGLLKGAGLGISKLLDNTAIKEFTDRLAFRRANIDPNEMIKHEAESVINTYNEMNNEVTGPAGLKAQAIAKLLPERVTPQISTQLQGVADKGQAAIQKMVDSQVPERYIKKFMGDMNGFMEVATHPDATVGQQFDAMNSLKQSLQDYSKGNYGPFAIPRYHEAYDFLNITKNLGREVRLALEDSSAWGKAADIQKELNASWTKVLPAAKDFQKKFMVKIGDVPEVSGDKLNTYMNQVGKATGTLDKQNLMKNFVEQMGNHFDTVDKIYNAAGIENPFGPVGMSALKDSLKVPSTGSKLADLWHSKLEAQTLGRGAGGAVGGAIGHTMGQGFAGAFLGEKVLGPVFTSLVKPLLERYSGADIKALEQAMRFGENVQKGNKTIVGAAAGLVGGASKISLKDLVPSATEISKLDDHAKALQNNMQARVQTTGNVGHYLPDHGTALAQTTTRALEYINSQRPAPMKSMPLDPEPKVTATQKYDFERKLQIAQQPLSIYHRIEQGTLTAQDVGTLRAIYPGYYNKMCTELMHAAVNQVSAGKAIPYKVQQSMSLFMGQPLNSTLTPESIQAAQSVFVAKAMQQQAQTQVKKGTSKLGNVAKNALTGDQAREQRQSQAGST